MKKEMSAASILFVVVGLAGAETLPAQAPSPPAACSAAEYRQFDFWIGNWNVTQGGKPAGTNRIDRILGGCALLENWLGVSGSVGNSLNYYDAARGVWHQTWIDNQGSPLELEGKFERGSLVLTGNTRDPASGQTMINRLTWTPQPGGNVRQHWETSTDGGTTWTTAFDGLYAKQ